MKNKRWLWCLAAVLTVSLLFAGIAFAEEEETIDFEYEFYSSSSKARIIKYIGSDTEVIIPDEIEGRPVAQIGVSAFEGNTEITSVTMGNSVELIEKNAFRECSSLKSITLSRGLLSVGRECFYHCTSLETLIIPDSVKAIGASSAAGAFEGCSSLKSVTIGDGVTIVPPISFRDCTALEQITFGQSVEQIHIYAFENCTSLVSLELPDSLTAIEIGAFKNCTALADIEFGGGLKTIASEAFYNCKSLTSLVLPDSLISTDNILPLHGVFEACTSLKAVNTGAGLENIADRMFYGCSALESAVIGSNVRILGEYSFYRCNDLKALRLPDSVEEIGYHAFEECAALERIDFGAGLKVIHGEAFRSCTALRNLVLPDSLERIEHPQYYRGVFEGCTALKRIVIGDGLEVLEERLFWGCVSLKEVVIGAGVQSIDNDAFWYCNGLERVYFQGDMPQCNLERNTCLTEDTKWYCLPGAEGFPETAEICETAYAVTFDCAGGLLELPDGTQAGEHTKYTQTGWTSEPLIPVREGYRFLGWNKDHVDDGCDYFDYNCCRFEEDAVLHAIWEKNSYKLLFDPKGGSIPKGSRLLAYGEPLGELPTPEMEDNTFLGWYCLDEMGAEQPFTQEDTMPAQNLILCAKWEIEAESVSVLLDTAGGSDVLPISIQKGELVQRPQDPVREGYRFLGWYKDAAGMEKFKFEEDLVEEATVLYAQWAAEETRLLPPLHPQNLTVSEVFDTTAELIWSAPEGAQGYRVYVDDVCVLDRPLEECRILLSDLAPETEYDIWVTAINEEGESGPASIRFTTEPTPEPEPEEISFAYAEIVSPAAEEAPSYDASCGGEGYVLDSGNNDPNYYQNGVGWYDVTNSGNVPTTTSFEAGHEYKVMLFFSAEEGYFFTENTEIQINGNTVATDFVNDSLIIGELNFPKLPDEEPCDGGEGCPSAKFTDVKATDWYHEAVDFAVENGLFGGMSENTFEPNTAMTRAMLVTVLWRYEGQPKEGTNSFTDVPDGQWYTDAVAWAAHNSIVGGVGDNKFDPNGNITREQMATILYRYASGKDIDTSARADLSGFPDAGNVSSYAKDPICWAVAEGLINGSDGKLLPQGNATRAQVATILMRFIENLIKD